jgi:hypothetical protein
LDLTIAVVENVFRSSVVWTIHVLASIELFIQINCKDENDYKFCGEQPLSLGLVVC